MLAVAHFMLGCAHLKKNLNRDALKNFEDANFFLRGNRLIDYKQLGLKYKLYGCEVRNGNGNTSLTFANCWCKLIKC